MNQRSTTAYVKGINRVQDYIENHLDEHLRVKELSKIAAFSEYHFLRIFAAMTGESLYGFIRRLRLEKASYMLLSDPKRPITDIALSVGFSNQASFAKAFKQQFGLSGSQYRLQKGSPEHSEPIRFHGSSLDPIPPLEINIRDEEPQRLIYLRYTGAYQGDSNLFSSLFQRLCRWADDQDLLSSSSRYFVIYHDFGCESDEKQLRISVCISVDREVSVDEQFGFLVLPAGRYGIGKFRLSPEDYAKAWYYMYARWLPESGYTPDDRFTLEHYPPLPLEGKKRLVEICIPIS